ncbi:MAG: flavodoxin family protein, partial [Deltaproteobacteria bacterium]|nr:flavodoxin family protein [Deltaproteobacteria bacterium]
CGLDDDLANRCIEAMRAADGILIGSPTYFADVTPETKALMDRAGLVARVNGDLWARKVGAGVVAVRRGGAIHAFDTINHFFLIGQMIVPGSSYWNLSIGLKPGDVDGDEEGVKTMEDLGRNMAWLLRRLHG